MKKILVIIIMITTLVDCTGIEQPDPIEGDALRYRVTANSSI